MASLKSIALESNQARATVFYDGACAPCRREIARYPRLDNADAVRWVDISRDQAMLDLQGLTRAEPMRRLHVRDAAGNRHTGAWALAELWSHLPGYRESVNALLRAATGSARVNGDYAFALSNLAVRAKDLVVEMSARGRYARMPPPQVLFLHCKPGGLYQLLNRLRASIPVGGLVTQGFADSSPHEPPHIARLAV